MSLVAVEAAILKKIYCYVRLFSMTAVLAYPIVMEYNALGNRVSK